MSDLYVLVDGVVSTFKGCIYEVTEHGHLRVTDGKPVAIFRTWDLASYVPITPRSESRWNYTKESR
ncbi:hypothetical protein [uncultured Arsenicicoccus sp.]|uniref:hypothetical protein n=1 Tax=uncultured Arsenicicoccus sp. TaxID=491339 RepID=UPI0025960443|nr:hypothetical protein [uncultured Arsenicicoccus sp.]